MIPDENDLPVTTAEKEPTEQKQEHYHYFKIMDSKNGAIRWCEVCGESYILRYSALTCFWEHIRESE